MGRHTDSNDRGEERRDRHRSHHERDRRDRIDSDERSEDRTNKNRKHKQHKDDRRRLRDEDRDRKRSRKRHRKEEDDDSDGEERYHRRREQKKRKRSHRDHGRVDEDDDSDRHRRKSKKKKKERSGKKNPPPKEDQPKRKSNPPDKRFLVPLGKALGHPPKKALDPTNDYFAFHKHLWVYLHREEGLAFNDMSSEETHEAFSRFVERYNLGELEADFYDPKGLPPAALEEAKTTRHTWSFQTSEMEERNLEAVQSSVRKQTDTDNHASNDSGAMFQQMPRKTDRDSERHWHRDDGDNRGSQRSEQRKDRAAERAANRRLKEHVRTAEEEFGGGRKEGRERQIERRKELSAKIHGASRDREAGIELTDDAIYGGGGGPVDDGMDFQAALARQKKRDNEKKQRQEARVVELEAKEKDKQAEMLRLLGLSGIQPGQKIKIAPREDDKT